MSKPSELPETRAPSPRWKRVAKRLGVVALALVLAGFLAEGLVLLILGEQVKFPRHVVAAPFGLRINQPDADYRHKSPDVEVWFHINSQGFRAPHDFAVPKPAGVKRILALGDSFTIGYEVAVEDCFASVLERELRAKGYDVEVINAGVSGYSTAEECLYLERELLKYEPDLVIVSFYTNDVQDNMRTHLFRVDGDALVADQPAYVPLGRFGNFLNTNPVLSFLSSYSNAFALLKETFTREYKSELTAEIRKDQITELIEEHQAAKQAPPSGKPPAQPAPQPEPPAPTPHVAPPAGEPHPAEEQHKLEKEPLVVPKGLGPELGQYPKTLAGKILQRMFDDCSSRGIGFVVQVIPHLTEDDQGRDKLATQFPFLNFDSNQSRLGFIDARTFLEPWLGKQQLYWLRSHRHWTPFSHELSGKTLAEYIDSRGMLPH